MNQFVHLSTNVLQFMKTGKAKQSTSLVLTSTAQNKVLFKFNQPNVDSIIIIPQFSMLDPGEVKTIKLFYNGSSRDIIDENLPIQLEVVIFSQQYVEILEKPTDQQFWKEKMNCPKQITNIIAKLDSAFSVASSAQKDSQVRPLYQYEQPFIQKNSQIEKLDKSKQSKQDSRVLQPPSLAYQFSPFTNTPQGFQEQKLLSDSLFDKPNLNNTQKSLLDSKFSEKINLQYSGIGVSNNYQNFSLNSSQQVPFQSSVPNIENGISKSPLMKNQLLSSDSFLKQSFDLDSSIGQFLPNSISRTNQQPSSNIKINEKNNNDQYYEDQSEYESLFTSKPTSNQQITQRTNQDNSTQQISSSQISYQYQKQKKENVVDQQVNLHKCVIISIISLLLGAFVKQIILFTQNK